MNSTDTNTCDKVRALVKGLDPTSLRLVLLTALVAELNQHLLWRGRSIDYVQMLTELDAVITRHCNPTL